MRLVWRIVRVVLTVLLVLISPLLLIVGCFAAGEVVRDRGVTKIEIQPVLGASLAARFPDADLVCEFTPGIKSPPDSSMIFTDDSARDAIRVVKQPCPNLRKADMPFRFLQPNESVFLTLKACRVTGIYKIKAGGAPLDGMPEGVCVPPTRLVVGVAPFSSSKVVRLDP